MKVLRTNQILEQHGIKPCVVKVKQNIFRKIKIGCSVSMDGIKLSCKMVQTGTNSFDIKVIRNETDSGVNVQGHGQIIHVNKYTSSLRSQGRFVPEQRKIGQANQKKRALVKAIKPRLVPVKQVKIGDIVLCKMRGYCAWPSKVITIENAVIDVEFFGDHTTNKTTIKNIFSFLESAEAILYNLKGRKDPRLEKAVKEAEIVLGIPMSLVDHNRHESQ